MVDSYADGNWTVRAAVTQAHIDYTRGLLHFWANDLSVPKATRDDMASWGLCADEWADTAQPGWPPQLCVCKSVGCGGFLIECAAECADQWPHGHGRYVRETRRMLGRYVMTQDDRMPDGGRLTKPDSIALGSYGFDNHNHQRIAQGGWVYNEGNINTNANGNNSWEPFPFELPYRSICPQETDATNLLVTCCLSASHIAYVD